MRIHIVDKWSISPKELAHVTTSPGHGYVYFQLPIRIVVTIRAFITCEATSVSPAVVLHDNTLHVWDSRDPLQYEGKSF